MERSCQLDNLIIFDGVCNLCTKSVHFILRHESGQVLRFTPLQSSTGSSIMQELGLNPMDAETFVLLSDGNVFVRSDAAIRLSGYLRGGWRFLGLFRVIPRPIRDWAYGLIARNRYRWFGRYEHCMVPSAQIRDRFIND